jgi:hypothetical protein
MSKEEDMKDKDALIVQPVERDSSGLVEVTTYIREDQACALEMIQTAEQQSRGAPCDQAELFQEALDLLIKSRIFMMDLRPRREEENEKALRSE